MDAFELTDVESEHAQGARLYHEFLRVPALSMGLYVLPAGSEDPQQPHDEDEVYVVTQGRAKIRVEGEDRPVQAGSIVYVAADEDHHFWDINEELHVLVFFAPAETTGN